MRGTVDGEVDARIPKEGSQQVVFKVVQRQIVTSHAVGDPCPHAVDLPNRCHVGVIQNRTDGDRVVGVDQ